MQQPSLTNITTNDAAEHLATNESLSTAQQPVAQEEDPYSLLTIRKRKYGTRWKQQHLYACRQSFDLLYIFILYASLGVVCLALGGVCYYFASACPKMVRVDYTKCLKILNISTGSSQPGPCSPKSAGKTGNFLNIMKSSVCDCKVNVTLTDDNLPKGENGRSVLFFELGQFHQNVRRYKKEVDWEQFKGRSVTEGGDLLSTRSCKSKRYKVDSNTSKPIFPCGKMANSYFSDKFKIFDAEGNPVHLDESNIAWRSDKDRFKNPPKLNEKSFDQVFAYPRDWHEGLKREFFSEKGVANEHFIVWMRSAALDKFRKKYGYLNKLKNGNYTIHVQYRFEVESYGGTKKVVIAADCEDRPVDYFFFYWYLAVGAFCLFFGPALLLINWVMNAFHKSSSSNKKPRERVSGQNQNGIPPNPSQNDLENDPTKDSTKETSTASVQ